MATFSREQFMNLGSAIAAACDHTGAVQRQSASAATRDWSGFFSGLATFITSVLPLIAPFFLTSDE